MASRTLVLATLVFCATCTDDTSDGVPCGTGDPCVAGEICYDDVCYEVCNSDADCPLALACGDGVCQQIANDCTSGAQCTSPSLCEDLAGATCRGGACRYPALPESSTCDDSNACTHSDVCDDERTCVGQTVECNFPPDAECVATDTARVYASSGTCEPTTGCSYRHFDLSCIGCPSCANACLLDRDGNGTVDTVSPGDFDGDDGCQVCDPGSGAFDWSAHACEQSANLCRLSVGTCDSSRNLGNCIGDACCAYDPVWPTGSGNPQPGCPLPGEDANGNLTEDGGETWNGACSHEGECLACGSDGDCSGTCECGDETCTVRRCSEVDCDCQFNSDGDGVCDGPLADGFEDPDDSCGALTCNGAGACHLADSEDCSDDNQCESNHCADDVCCATGCAGSCDSCDVDGTAGTCVEVDSCGGDCSACVQEGAVFNCVAQESVCDVVCVEATCDDEGSGVFNCDDSACTTPCSTINAPNNAGDCGTGIDVQLASGCRYTYYHLRQTSSSVSDATVVYECVDGTWDSVSSNADGGPCGGCTPEEFDTWSDNCGNTSSHREDC